MPAYTPSVLYVYVDTSARSQLVPRLHTSMAILRFAAVGEVAVGLVGGGGKRSWFSQVDAAFCACVRCTAHSWFSRRAVRRSVLRVEISFLFDAASSSYSLCAYMHTQYIHTYICHRYL